MSNDGKVIGAIAILSIALLALFAVLGGKNAPVQTDPITKEPPELVREYSPRKGPDEAPVQIIEFADLQCPACARTQPLLEQAVAEFGDKLQLVFRHYPLASHANSQVAARSAEAAGAQSKFWEMADKLYAEQSSWSFSSDAAGVFEGYATELGLDITRFLEDRNNQELIDHMRIDMGDGDQFGITGTPTLFLNGERLAIPGDYAELKAAIEARLAAAGQ